MKTTTKLFFATIVWVIIVTILFMIVDMAVSVNKETAPLVLCLMVFIGFLEIFRRLPSDKDKQND